MQVFWTFLFLYCSRLPFAVGLQTSGVSIEEEVTHLDPWAIDLYVILMWNQFESVVPADCFDEQPELAEATAAGGSALSSCLATARKSTSFK